MPRSGKEGKKLGTSQEKTKKSQSQRIFVVHGYDENMLSDVDATIHKMGFEPIHLNSKSESIEIFLNKISEYQDIKFAVVLLSDDAVAAPRSQFPKNAVLCASQSVVLQLGFMLSQCGADRVLILFQPRQNFERPLDHEKLHYAAFDSSGRWQFDFIRDLKNCGYDVDANKLL
jgi:predicted nucleotide-binding protein